MQYSDHMRRRRDSWAMKERSGLSWLRRRATAKREAQQKRKKALSNLFERMRCLMMKTRAWTLRVEGRVLSAKMRPSLGLEG